MQRFRRYTIYLAGILLVIFLAFACSDGGPSDPGINGNGGNSGGDNGGQTPTNSPMTVEVEAPSELQAGVDEGTWSFAVEDDDGIASIELTFTTPEEEHDFTIIIEPQATQWDTIFSHTFSHTGQATFSWKITDAFDGEPETNEGSDQTTITEQPANSPMVIEADGPDQLDTGQQGTWSLSVQDEDGIEEIELEFITPGGEHNFTQVINPQSTEWDTTFTHSFSQAGKTELTWTITDAYEFGEPEVQSGELQTTIAAKLIAYTLEGTLTNPVLDNPAVGVTAELRGPGGELLDQGESAADGTVSLSHSQPEDELTNGFKIGFSGMGYLDADLDVDLAQETFSKDLEPTPITFSSATDEIEPRGDIMVDLLSLADGGEMQIEQITIEQTSTNLSSEQQSGTTYRLSVENDVAATTESITIRARTVTNDQSGQVEVPIGERAFIEITQTLFEVTEDDTLALNLANYVNSGADIDSLHISTSASQLEIIRDGSGLFTLIPDKDYYGDLQVELYASNVHGSETTQSGLLQVERLPRATVRVENNETNEHTPGLTAHLGVYNSSGALTDSLASSNGVFEIKLREEAENRILARYTRGGDAFSYIRTDQIENTGADQEHTIRVVDFYIREQNGTIVDELKQGEPGIATPEGFRKWATEGGLDGVGSWNGDRVNISPPGPGTFNYYTQSSNGRGPDKLLVAEIFHRIDNGNTSYLTDRVKNIMLDVYNNDIAPWMGEFAPETEIVDSLAYDWENNQYMNKPFFAPNSHPELGEAGRVFVFGEYPNSIYNASAWIRNDGQGSDAQIESATSQEATAAFGFMSRTPANNWAEPDQSIVRNGNLLQRPSLFDGKLMRAVWEETYGPPTRSADNILYVEDVFGKPEY